MQNAKLEIWSYGYIKKTLDDEDLKIMAKPFFSSLLTQSMSHKNTLPETIKNIYNTLSKNKNFIPFLMPDLLYYDKQGDYLNEYLVTDTIDITNEKHGFFIDTSKIFYIYCQMHFISSKYPEAKINFTFYDNEEQILTLAHEHFSEFALDIPENITLIFNQINMNMLVVESEKLSKIEGQGQAQTFNELKNISINLKQAQTGSNQSTFKNVVGSCVPGQVNIRKSITEVIQSTRDYFNQIKINNGIQESDSPNDEFAFSSPSFVEQSSSNNKQTIITSFNVSNSNLSSPEQKSGTRFITTNSLNNYTETSHFSIQSFNHDSSQNQSQERIDEVSTDDHLSLQMIAAPNNFLFKTFGFILAGIALATALITLMMAINIISVNLTSTLLCGLASLVLGIGSGVCFNNKQPETKGFTPN